MSAKDRLDTYERDWDRHLLWREPDPQRCHGSLPKPGAYVEKSGIGLSNGPAVRFFEMPLELRDRVATRLESAIRQLVDDEHAAVLIELKGQALAEAKRTLEELGGQA